MHHLLAAALALLSAPTAPLPAQTAPAEPRHRYFEKAIDLWRDSPACPPASEPSAMEVGPLGKVPVRESVWAQPLRTPEGNWMIYVPPKEVLDFLENPTEGSARAYLAWKAEQSSKLATAMKLLAEAKAPAAAHEVASPAPADTPFRITYFKKPSCPHCVTQDGTLSTWLAKRKGGTLDLVLPGDRPELWKVLRVRGTPTLLLEVGVSDPPRQEVLVGLQSEGALEAALARLTLPPPVLTADPPRKEPSR